jgi:hypothetical protein
MRTTMNTMCYNMCGMCSMPDLHIYRIGECDVFMLQKKC